MNARSESIRAMKNLSPMQYETENLLMVISDRLYCPLASFVNLRRKDPMGFNSTMVPNLLNIEEISQERNKWER